MKSLKHFQKNLATKITLKNFKEIKEEKENLDFSTTEEKKL